ncbi:hypothetical protein IKL64_06215 [bacterium]|nr:hypothetical protein [bacterium]
MSSRIVNEPIRCVLGTTVKGKQTVNEYMLESGKYITEIITDLGRGQIGVREIYRNSSKADDIEKIVDRLFGRLEVFYPSKIGVIKEFDGIKCTFPNLSMEILLKKVAK